MKKKILALVLSLIAVLIGLLMPKVIMTASDSKLSKADISLNSSTDASELKNSGKLSLADKMGIIASRDNYYVSVNSGKTLDKDKAIDVAVQFIETMKEFFGQNDEAKLVKEDSLVDTLVVTADYGAGDSFIVWQISTNFDDYIMQFVVDDEFGKVIRFTINSSSHIGIPEASEEETGIAVLGMMLADYYDAEFIGMDYPSDSNPGLWGFRLQNQEGNLTIPLQFRSYVIVVNDATEILDETKDEAQIDANDA